MDNFESYLFDKINDYRQRLEENKDSKELNWALGNTIEEFMEILSEYNLNYKYDIGA